MNQNLTVLLVCRMTETIMMNAIRLGNPFYQPLGANWPQESLLPRTAILKPR